MYCLFIYCLLIHFIGNLIGPKGAKSIGDALKVNITLQELYLCGTVYLSFIDLFLGNQIGDEGAETIGEALKVNHTLRHLDLGSIIFVAYL